MTKKLIIYVDDDPLQLDAMVQRLEATLGCQIIQSASIEDGKRKITEHSRKLDLVITDMHFGDTDKEGGLRIVEHASKIHSTYVPVIVLTGKGNTENAVRSMELGAFSYVEKGLEDGATIKLLLHKAKHAFKRKSLESSLDRRLRENKANAKRISADLKRAQRLQTAFLPGGSLIYGGCEIMGRYDSCDEVGGDFYSYAENSDGTISFAIGDAMGHGLTAALLAAMVRATIDSAINPSPSAVNTCAKLLENITFLRPPFSATMFYGNIVAKHVEYFSAGHVEALLLRTDGEVVRLKSTGRLLTFLGKEIGATLGVETVLLTSGDRLVLCTDGITEARNGSGVEFTIGRLEDVVKSCRDLSISGILHRIFTEVSQFSGKRVHDDRTVLIVDYKGN